MNSSDGGETTLTITPDSGEHASHNLVRSSLVLGTSMLIVSMYFYYENNVAVKSDQRSAFPYRCFRLFFPVNQISILLTEFVTF